MKVLDIKVMRGPNYWSNYRQQVIVMKLDLEELENFPTDKIPGFADRIETLIPSLYEHRCSEKVRGGFFQRVKDGTWMGHVVEHIALEIQALAGMNCGYGRTRSSEQKGIYYIIFSYEIERAGLYAADAALRIAEALVEGIPYDINEDINELKYLNEKYGLGPTTLSLIKEAKKRNIPFKRVSNDSLIQFGYGIYQKQMRASIASTTSLMGVEAACNKEETKRILAAAHIPVAKDVIIKNESDLDFAIERIGFPFVIKPINGNHGRGITINIQSKEHALIAFHLAKTVSDEVMIEGFVEGFDYRFLLINYKLVAVAKRTPAMVMGDGASTIGELIKMVNEDPNRGECHEKVLTTIKVDEITNKILVEKNYSLDTVLPLGEILFLKNTANLSTGGTSRDVTDLVHPYNILMAERIARLMNLDICGIDIMARDINIPINEKSGAILEVNACPGFRMHLCPSKGLPRNVAEHVMNMLYPDNAPSRIPVVAVTGTNGKTTTTRLVAHLAKAAGHKVGFTTTDGIYIQNHLIYSGDCTGARSTEAILGDPTVDFAVLECARGGILRTGLGFDHCDISIITNIAEDHLGLNDVNSVEEMSRVKGVVARSTTKNGYAILNADDDLVFDMIKTHTLECKIALFSIYENNPRVKEHCAKGGLAAIMEKGYLVICKGEWKTRIERIANIPLTYSGKAEFMVKNILAATLAASIQNFNVDDIRSALKSFIPSPEFTPGRLNIFHFRNFDFMVDYTHNAAGFNELKKFIEKTDATLKVGIIAPIGDRRDEDIRNMGKCAAPIFDEIIIRLDVDLRGRTAEELTSLIMEGIRSVNPDVPCKFIRDEHEAMQYTIDNAVPGSFITVCTERVSEAIAYVTNAIEKEKEEQNTGALVYMKAS